MGPHPQWYLPLIDGFSMIENGQAKKRGVGGGVGLRNKKKGGKGTSINSAGRRKVCNKTGGGNARGM